jgi:hypothetical protein
MKALESYVERKNAWGKIFKNKPLDLNNPIDRQKIADSIDADLSPENLTCDGELDGFQIRARHKQLTQAAKELKQLDPSVKFYEFG